VVFTWDSYSGFPDDTYAWNAGNNIAELAAIKKQKVRADTYPGGLQKINVGLSKFREK